MNKVKPGQTNKAIKACVFLYAQTYLPTGNQPH